MDNPWDADYRLETTQVRQLLARDLPERAADQLTLLGEGWDNWVFLLEDPQGLQPAYTLRFPRRAEALELMQQEWAALGYLAPRLNMELPRPIQRGEALEGVFDFPYAVYSLISGQTACRARLSRQERQGMVPALAHFLKSLHALPAGEWLSLGIPDDTIQRADIAHRKRSFHTYIEQALALLPEGRWLQGWWQALPEQTPSGRPQTLVHGDLYARHLIVDAERQLSGVIDWGDVHRGDPAMDLALVYAYLPPESHAEFWQIYGEISPETQMMACFRAVYSCVYLLVYGAKIQDRALWDVAHQGLDWLHMHTLP